MNQLKNILFYILFYTLCVKLVISSKECRCTGCDCDKLGGEMSNKFLYFAYGSNLLAKRIHINSPSAVRKGLGQLKGYRLDFNLFSNTWKGAAATIVPDKNNTVWGAIWEINKNTMDDLDRQEGVDKGIYFPFNATIELPNKEVVICRVYQQTKNPPSLEKGEKLPEERQPSAVYLNTIIKGAEETGLPDFYQEYLKTIPHNGYNGKVDVPINLEN